MENEKDIHVKLLHDTMNDLRVQQKFQRVIIAALSGIIVLLIVAMSCISVYAVNRFIKFVETTDFSSVVEMTTDNSSTGTMTLNDKNQHQQ